mmetsp:Transcript_11228/g.24778  ORF Transcript_11228/g.24778 Transcript_11228/m.24778 type:complete len:231 (+) Transcript_11228:682-1374(+)
MTSHRKSSFRISSSISTGSGNASSSSSSPASSAAALPFRPASGPPPPPNRESSPAPGAGPPARPARPLSALLLEKRPPALVTGPSLGAPTLGAAAELPASERNASMFNASCRFCNESCMSSGASCTPISLLKRGPVSGIASRSTLLFSNPVAESSLSRSLILMVKSIRPLIWARRVIPPKPFLLALRGCHGMERPSTSGSGPYVPSPTELRSKINQRSFSCFFRVATVSW